MNGAGRGAQLEVARIQSEINRLFEMLLRLRDGDDVGGNWSPGVDVAETETHLVVEIEAPGIGADRLDLFTQSGNLCLKGNRPRPALREQSGAEVLHDERDYGPFVLEIPLTCAVNPRQADARLEQGLLRIDLPKVQNRRGASVPIPIRAEKGVAANANGGVNE